MSEIDTHASTSPPPLLAAHGLRKTFAARRGPDQVALAGVDLTIPAEGGAVGVVGESGSGKSTLTRVLAGLLVPDAGTVEVRGRRRDAAARGRRARLDRAREIQMVFQDPYLSLDPHLTVRRCLDEMLREHFDDWPADRRANRIDELVDAIGLREGALDARPRQLSGGERQRVAIARALAVEPSILLLDEAVSALDVSTQFRILELLKRLRAELGVSYVFVTHDLGVAQDISDRILVMRRGSVVEEGAVADVLTRPTHPYTRLLLDSIPREGWDLEALLQSRVMAEPTRDLAPSGGTHEN